MIKTEDHHLVEALLISSRDPLSVSDLSDRLPLGVDVEACLEKLSEDYRDRSISIVEVPGGWTIRTKPESSDLCRELLSKPLRMTRSTLETLAIIAYFQPVTRTEIERVRGVSLAKGTLDILIWAGLVRPGPRRQTPGSPLTFLTTDQFLRQYSFVDLEDLPHIAALREEGLLNANREFDIKDEFLEPSEA